MVVHQCSGSSAEFTAGPALLEASWVWPSTKHGSMKAACDLRPAGPWNATEQDMPPPILSASHAIQASSAGRLRVFLDKLSAPEDCCTNVIVVGGSVPCGHGFPGCGGSKVMFANTTAAGGLPGAWPTWLKRWLDWSRPKCCPSGHVVTNLCVGATGIDYVLATLRTRVLPRLATSAAHLVLVDTAVNDYNEYFYVKRCQWRRCISQEEIKRKWQLTQVMAEALIRQLLLLNVSVAFVENARFEVATHQMDTVPGPPMSRYSATTGSLRCIWGSLQKLRHAPACLALNYGRASGRMLMVSTFPRPATGLQRCYLCMASCATSGTASETTHRADSQSLRRLSRCPWSPRGSSSRTSGC